MRNVGGSESSAGEAMCLNVWRWTFVLWRFEGDKVAEPASSRKMETTMKIGITTALALSMTAVAVARSTFAQPGREPRLALTGGAVIDGTGAPRLEDAVVLVEDGRIRAVGPR